MRIFTGPILRRLDAAKGPQKVCTPDLRTAGDIKSVFKPVISERAAQFIKQTDFKHGGRVTTADQFEYCGGEYPPGTMFYVDERDLLLGYEWQASKEEHWRVVLIEAPTA